MYPPRKYGAIPRIYPMGSFCTRLKPPCWQPIGNLLAGLQRLSVRAGLAVSAPGTKQILHTRMPRLWEQGSLGTESIWVQTGTMVEWRRLYHPAAWIQILPLQSAGCVCDLVSHLTGEYNCTFLARIKGLNIAMVLGAVPATWWTLCVCC